MSSDTYLVVMVGVILLVAVISAPALFTKRCASCGARNRLAAPECRACQAVFPETDKD